MKPSSISVELLDSKESPNQLVIVWDSGKIQRVPAMLLRKSCPCASCNLPGGPKGLPITMEIRNFSWVGNYAVNFVFSDGHDSGIYTYGHLSQIGD